MALESSVHEVDFSRDPARPALRSLPVFPAPIEAWFETFDRGRELSTIELERLAHDLSRRPYLWRHEIQHAMDERHYVRLLAGRHVEIWLICWCEAQGTGFHDHAGSRGAVAVVEGELEERLLAQGEAGPVIATARASASPSARRESTTCSTPAASPPHPCTPSHRRSGRWGSTRSAPRASSLDEPATTARSSVELTPDARDRRRRRVGRACRARGAARRPRSRRRDRRAAGGTRQRRGVFDGRPAPPAERRRRQPERVPRGAGAFRRVGPPARRPHRPGAFAPRALYGLYLAETLRAQATAAAGRLMHVRSAASSVVRTARGWTIRLEGGGALAADELVVAVGHAPAACPTGVDPVLTADHGYVGDPWGGWTRAPIDGVVLCIGTGLTAVDVALTVAADNPAARVVAISRHGLRPLEHRPPGSAAEPPTAPAVKPGTALGLLRAIRAEVALNASQGGDWRDVVNRLRPSTQEIWSRLPLAERHRFAQRLARYWEVHRHRLAPDVALAVRALEREGRLTFAAATMTAAERRGEGIRVRLSVRGGGDAELDVVRVVNCTGLTARVSGHPVLGRMEAAGLCAPGPLGLGLATGPAGEVLDRAGTPSGAYTLGPLRRGDLWETTSIPEIRAQAYALAATLRDRAPVAAAAALDWRELQLA